MTDIHSHILFDVDDGARNIEESITLLKKMAEIGFKNVILTPHYIKDSEYSSQNKEKIVKIKKIQEELDNQNIDINIYLGNEIFINNQICDLIKEEHIYTLNNSKYILVELPFHNQIVNLEDIVYELRVKGLIPIIAHPERYTYFQKNYKEVDRLREEGFLFQGNYASILGYYGKESKKLLKYMLKKQYIDYLGTDIHRTTKTYVIDNFKKIEKKILKITKEDYYKEIKDNCNNLVK